MKKVADATADNNAAGDGWFKIWESGYNEEDGKWCSQRIIENNGHLSVNIPADIQAGYYLVRPELLALHAAADNPPDPQFYVGCAQVFVQGSGNETPKGVNIGEGTYDLDTPGMKFNIWDKPMKLPYPMFGPPVYKGAAAPGTAKEANSTGSASQGSNGDDNEVEDDEMDLEKRAPMVQTIGLKPKGCILVRDNWCGFEVPSYNTEDGCWASSEKCWDQSDVCWNTALPTGNKNCEIWQKKCEELDDSCKNRNFNGPPNKGKDLTPTPPPLTGSRAVFERDLARKREIERRDFRRRVVSGVDI